LVGTLWYGALSTLQGTLATDIALLGLLLFATLSVWIFGRPPIRVREPPQGSHGKWMTTVLLSTAATGIVAALGTLGVSTDRMPGGHPVAAVVVFIVMSLTLLLTWGGWVLLVGLMLVMMGASIRPAWLLNVSGRWLPWVPVAIGLLTAYQLVLLPGVPAKAVAVALPTNLAYGALGAFAVLGLSRDVLRARSELAVSKMSPAGSVLVGAVPLALLHISRALWTVLR
jgi:hypothetical protein